MIIKEDFSKYLSVDNGRGLLLKRNDVFVLSQYGIKYSDYADLNDLILEVSNFIDAHYYEDIDDLEEVLSNLVETYYYTQIKK